MLITATEVCMEAIEQGASDSEIHRQLDRALLTIAQGDIRDKPDLVRRLLNENELLEPALVASAMSAKRVRVYYVIKNYCEEYVVGRCRR